MGRGMASMMWLLYLLLSLAMTMVQSNKIPYFGLLISPDLYYPSMDKFCLHSPQDLQGFSQISVVLNISSGSINLYTVQPEIPQWICQSFQVPEPTGPTEKATIVVQGTDIRGRRIEFSSKEVTLRKKNTRTFIKTDKAVDKPGQKVMFRMVTMDQDMEVLNKTDSHENQLGQWKNVQADSGIAELSHQLPPEAKPGPFNIKTRDTSSDFMVDKYVLPKFDVSRDAANSISVSDEKLSITLLARYTYGKKVTGDATQSVRKGDRDIGTGGERKNVGPESDP